MCDHAILFMKLYLLNPMKCVIKPILLVVEYTQNIMPVNRAGTLDGPVHP